MSKRPVNIEEREPNEGVMRLQKYLAICGLGSRRGAEDLIAAGRVAVNGVVITEFGTKVDPTIDSVIFDGKEVGIKTEGLLLLNKPDGVICSKSDPQGRTTVMEYVPKKYQHYFPVGRLDFETTGLLLLTNDGELSQYLLHPRYEIPRVYEALVFHEPSRETLQQLKDGIELEDGLAWAHVSVLRREERGFWLRVELAIGRNRVVRRLLAAAGHKVHRLTRVSHGPFTLGALALGEVKHLEASDIAVIKSKIRKEIESM
jgi:23S rRNA pseudouridine2605 synthase